jgi:hypothetical protein
MDAIVNNLKTNDNRPTEAEAEEAVRTLLRWVGDDINREGLLDTPKRVVKAYKELFSGYDQDAEEELGRTFEEVAGYDDIVLVKDIPFFSHCEHHMVPIIGKAHVAYLPDGKVLRRSQPGARRDRRNAGGIGLHLHSSPHRSGAGNPGCRDQRPRGLAGRRFSFSRPGGRDLALGG